MKIFDCTLRDGANVVGNGFSAELTLSMVTGLSKSNISTIELGNAKGVGNYEKLNAVAPLDDEGYMKLVKPYADDNELGMFIVAPNVNEHYVNMAKQYGLKFLRVGAPAGAGSNSIGAVNMVKKAGLTCYYSLMKAYTLSADELAEEAKLLADAGVDIITIMDSAGMMLPDMVTEYVSKMKANVNIPIGFHGHNNLGLSVGNAIAAVNAGAEVIDTGLLGMARSAGNCATELVIGALQRMGFCKDIDLMNLLKYLDDELIPAMSKYNYRVPVMPKDLVYGISGCHSNFGALFEKVASEENVSLYELIIKGSEIDMKAPSEEMLRNVAAQLK